MKHELEYIKLRLDRMIKDDSESESGKLFHALVKAKDAVGDALFDLEPVADSDPYAELKAAHAAGKVIQFYTIEGEWKDCTPLYNWPPDRYRIKPAPKLVPLTSDDLPPVVWVRRAKYPDALFSVLILQPAQFYCAAELVFVENWPLWEWSPDRKTWHSFMKEVEG